MLKILDNSLLSSFNCDGCGAAVDLTQASGGFVRCSFCGRVYQIKNSASVAGADILKSAQKDLLLCDWDKAEKGFLLAANDSTADDSTTAAAYYGAVQARYGVQYIFDTANNRSQPVVHRLLDTPFSKDKLFRTAISLAPDPEKAVYLQEAAQIDRIYNSFKRLADKGVKYDTFICVKVSTEDGGGRTNDSETARKIYNYLKREGLTPFYSEEILADASGEDYEAHILYALHSARSMIIVCFDKSYLDTSWVKNEYTRYIAMLHDKEKSEHSLTFVYKDTVIDRLPGVTGKIQGVRLDADTNERVINFVKRNITAAPDIPISQIHAVPKSIKEPKPPREPWSGRKKRAFSAVILSLVVALVLSIGLSQVDWQRSPNSPQSAQGFVFLLNFDSTEYTVMGGANMQGGFVIPATFNGLPVTAISDDGFRNQSGITSLGIQGNNLKIIGAHAFLGCTGISNIVIPTSVTSLNSTAFRHWNPSQTVIFAGRTQFETESVLGSAWRNVSDARFVYNG